MKLKRLNVGDCIEFMSSIKKPIIQTTVTSPPYNKGEKSCGNNIPKVMYQNFTDDIPEEDYQAWQVQVLDALFDITKSGGSCFYNHKTRYVKGVPIYPFTWLQKSKWQIRQHIIWDRRSTGNLYNWRFFQTHEDIFWLWKPNGKSAKDNRVNMGMAKQNCIWPMPPYQRKDKTHPCMYPPALPATAILASSKENDIVFDPFCGAGTTLLAAKLLNRRYIGIDVSRDYMLLTKKRLSNPEKRDVLAIEKVKALSL